ncbi:hypothetical protein AVEN_142292-1 [Araneus ventricosus]|uniref:Uncharacterized protein n=1 Tax=Araneus ventricosus TaxID=182803 RepID=A0A4Y2MZG1_ARAVE|nr:hypothetical protein AVEN_142292-1 [Araneus ventricosus]
MSAKNHPKQHKINYGFEVHSVTITTNCVPNFMAVSAIDSSGPRRHTHTSIAFYKYRKPFPSKATTGDVQVKSCFGNEIFAETATFSFVLHKDGKPVEIEAVISDQLEIDGIFSPDCLKLFRLNELADVKNEQINPFSSETQNKLPFFQRYLIMSRLI